MDDHRSGGPGTGSVLSDDLRPVGRESSGRALFKRLQAGLGIGLSVTCLAWLVHATKWRDVWTALTRMDYGLIAVATLLNLASVLIRTTRWQLMFQPRAVPSFGRLMAALLVGQAVNLLAPARLGDLARATLANGERMAFTLGTLVTELALDLLMMIALVVFLLSQVALPPWWRGSGRTFLVAAGAALAAIVAVVLGRRWMAGALGELTVHHPWGRRVLDAARQLLLGLDNLGQPTRLLRLLGWSALIWVFYGAVNYVLLGAVRERLSILTALFLLVVLQLGVAIPSSPGRIGVFHYLCVRALSVFGVDGGKALSYAVTLHLISVVMPVVLGTALAWQRGVSLWSAGDGVEL